MRKLVFIFLLFALPAFGQGFRIGDNAPITSSLTTPGQISTVTSAIINICVSPANAVPCTNKATTFTSVTLGTPCATSTQVVLSGTNSCIGTTDIRGNWGAWVAAGNYDWTVTVSTGQSFGPWTVSVGFPAGSSISPGTINGPTTYTGNNTHSGTETFNGPLNSTNTINGSNINSKLSVCPIPCIYTTLAAAIAAAPSTGALIDEPNQETFNVDPFAGNTKSVVVTLGLGVWTTNATINVQPATSRLVGQGRGNDLNTPTYQTTIKAGPSFPTSGPVNGGAALVKLVSTQGGRIENLGFDCNGVANSSALYATDINEQAGFFNISIGGCPNKGIFVDASAFTNIPAQNYSIRDIECIPGTAGSAGTTCIHLKGNGGGGPALVQNITANGIVGNVIGNSILVEGFNLGTFINLHTEQSTNGFATVNSASCVSFITVTGLSAGAATAGGQNLVNIPAACTGSGYTFLNLVKNGATNTLVDAPRSNTNTDSNLSYIVGPGAIGAQEIWSTSPSIGKFITGGPTFLGNVLGKASFRATQQIADQGTACTNGELALSAGWQSTGSATVTAVTGNGQTCSWTITTGTTTAANPTVTDTLTNALPAATTVCELNIHGGTHTPAAGEGFQQTTLSATAPIFTFIGTPTAGGTTYFVTRRCGP